MCPHASDPRPGARFRSRFPVLEEEVHAARGPSHPSVAIAQAPQPDAPLELGQDLVEPPKVAEARLCARAPVYVGTVGCLRRTDGSHPTIRRVHDNIPDSVVEEALEAGPKRTKRLSEKNRPIRKKLGRVPKNGGHNG